MITPAVGESAAEYVADTYRAAELRILARITDALAQGLDAPRWDVEALGRIQLVRDGVLADLDAVAPAASSRIREVLVAAYGRGEASALADARQAIGSLEATPTEHLASVAALAREASSGVQSMAPGILRRVDDIYRGVIAEASAGVAAGAETRREAVSRALARFAAERPDVLSVPTRRGSMSLPTYTTMAVRTATARAAIQGHLDVMDANDLDLVVINPGPRACDICDRWARAILARSGKAGTIQAENVAGDGTIEVRVDDTLDNARAAGWGHPNCRCGISVYLPGATDPSIIERPPWDQQGYEAQQRQRAIERNIRGWKQRQALALSGSAESREAAQQVRRWQEQQRDHLEAYPQLKRQSWREQLSSNLGDPRRPDYLFAQGDAADRERRSAPADVDVPTTGVASMPRLDADETPQRRREQVNRRYGTSRRYDVNCSAVTMAQELRARGIDVRAAGMDEGITWMQYASHWRTAAGEAPVFTSAREVGTIADRLPVGSRATVFYIRRDGSAHFTNAVIEDGEFGPTARFYEGQNSATSHADVVADINGSATTLGYLRMDDLEPADDIVDTGLVEPIDERADALADAEGLVDRLRRDITSAQNSAANMLAMAAERPALAAALEQRAQRTLDGIPQLERDLAAAEAELDRLRRA